MKGIKAISSKYMERFDSLAVGVIDFEKQKYSIFEKTPYDEERVFFDLASLTKPLTNGLCFLANPDLFTKDMQLLLNHSGGLPAWGRLSQKNWREMVFNYLIKESVTTYSDFSALRLMLEIERKSKSEMKKICSPYWDKDIRFWKDLPYNSFSPITGNRNGEEVMGVVHDDNAFVIDAFCSHAGLFGTIGGLCKTLLRFDKELNLISKIDSVWDEIPSDQRFIAGWDRALDKKNTLAGEQCGDKTFGHLGFTGTSIWIDCQKKVGIAILSNATQKFWYDKANINELRKKIANLAWNDESRKDLFL